MRNLATLVLALMLFPCMAQSPAATPAWQVWLSNVTAKDNAQAQIDNAHQKAYAIVKADEALEALRLGWSPEKLGTEELCELVYAARDACNTAFYSIYKVDGLLAASDSAYGKAREPLQMLSLKVANARLTYIELQIRCHDYGKPTNP